MPISRNIVSRATSAPYSRPSAGMYGAAISRPSGHWYTRPWRSFYNNYYRVWKDRNSLQRSYLPYAPDTFGSSPSERLTADLRNKSLATRVFYNLVVNPGHRPGDAGIGLGATGGQGKRDQALGSLSTILSTMSASSRLPRYTVKALRTVPRILRGAGLVATGVRANHRLKDYGLALPWLSLARNAHVVGAAVAHNRPAPDNHVARLLQDEGAAAAVNAMLSPRPADTWIGHAGNFAALPIQATLGPWAERVRAARRAKNLQALAQLSGKEIASQTKDTVKSAWNILRESVSRGDFKDARPVLRNDARTSATLIATNPQLQAYARELAIRKAKARARRDVVKGVRHMLESTHNQATAQSVGTKSAP